MNERRRTTGVDTISSLCTFSFRNATESSAAISHSASPVTGACEMAFRAAMLNRRVITRLLSDSALVAYVKPALVLSSLWPHSAPTPPSPADGTRRSSSSNWCQQSSWQPFPFNKVGNECLRGTSPIAVGRSPVGHQPRQMQCVKNNKVRSVDHRKDRHRERISLRLGPIRSTDFDSPNPPFASPSFEDQIDRRKQTLKGRSTKKPRTGLAQQLLRTLNGHGISCTLRHCHTDTDHSAPAFRSSQEVRHFSAG